MNFRIKMNNHFLLLILFSSFCFSQNDTIKKINRIDSLYAKAVPYKTYNITINKAYNLHNGYSSGIGKSNLSLYCNNENKVILLTKAIYNEHIQYKNGMIEKRTGHFYYINNELFFIKIKVKQIKKNETIQDEFNYSFDELLKTKSLKNLLLFNVLPWVREKNQEILKSHFKK